MKQDEKTTSKQMPDERCLRKTNPALACHRGQYSHTLHVRRRRRHHFVRVALLGLNLPRLLGLYDHLVLGQNMHVLSSL